MNNPQITAGEVTGRIVTEDGVISEGTLRIVDGKITSIEGEVRQLTATTGFNPEGNTIVPGFIDLHNHGGFGGAFPTGNVEQARRAALFHRSQGTTTLLASLVSAPADAIIAQVGVLAQLCREGVLFGIHLEGPYINACRCGAQNPEHIYPGNPADFARIIAAGEGWIRSITLAPETAELDHMLDLCAQHGIIASFGHTDADFDTTMAAVDAAKQRGITVTATHLFNAMPPLHHRAPGAAGALLAAANAGDAFVELVSDGVHLADGTVDMARASGNAFSVTDAMEAAGMPDGDYILGVLDVVVANGVARLRTGTGEPGAIAGGTSCLAQQFTRHVARGMTLIDAVSLTSSVPARVLGLTDRGISIGSPANIVVFDSTGKMNQVWSDGAII